LSISDTETVVAPTVEAAVAQAVKPVEAAISPKPVVSGAKCTRDTRGEADCDVKDCENCK
jgi:hypothetical protein